jgi:hypothetical protein
MIRSKSSECLASRVGRVPLRALMDECKTTGSALGSLQECQSPRPCLCVAHAHPPPTPPFFVGLPICFDCTPGKSRNSPMLMPAELLSSTKGRLATKIEAPCES